MQLMVGLFGLTNGATVSLLPGSHSPFAMVVLNINDAQTRKSNVFVELRVSALAAEEHSAKLYARARQEHRAHSEAVQVCAQGDALDQQSSARSGESEGGSRARGQTPRAVGAAGTGRKGAGPGLKIIMMAEFTLVRPSSNAARWILPKSATMLRLDATLASGIPL